MSNNVVVVDSGSDSDSEPNVPDSVTAQKLVKEFENVTNTDEILAQMHLQEHGWDLSKALNTYFAGVCDTAEQGLALQAVTQAGSGSQAPAKNLDQALQEGLVTTQAPESLVFVTWNIDGLDQHNLKKRTKAVAKILEQEAADIVFLQEVIPETFSYLESKLPGYQCVAGSQENYFVATLLRRGRVYLDSSTVHQFPGTRMYRHLLSVSAHCGSVHLELHNSHLESTKEHGEERMGQLKHCLTKVSSAATPSAVIFAGDLNMRDAELASVGGLPRGVGDVWQQCGARKEAQWTWDMQRNSNLQANFGKFRPKCRFDRIYLRDSQPASVRASQFGLVGLQKITGTQSFPSDHWGLRAKLELRQEGARKRKAE